MIFQPRKNGDAIVETMLPVLIRFEGGLLMRYGMRLKVQIHNRKRFAITAGWDKTANPSFGWEEGGYKPYVN